MTANSQSGIRIGVDLGGTKIEIIAIDANRSEIVRRRIATPQNDYEATLRAIAALVRGVEEELVCTASVGVGTPGAASRRSGLIKNANSTVLIGKNLKHDIEQRLDREIRTANDANCLVLSEAIDGAGRGSRVVFGVILGTGVGGGIAVDGRILEGSAAIAGEWGHIPLPWLTAEEDPGSLCYCGKYGCIETWLSGPALSAQFQKRTGERTIPTQIARLALAGNITAAQCLARYEDRLARGLAVAINILDPDVIVLGGGVSNIDRFYPNVPKLLTKYVFGCEFGSTLQRASLGDSSGVRGAALLW
ncbi:MAG: ROK family protein [Candidatus Eremiobacteraeota bacterium]|nr:ROK family protein [Candidatus Eremiobacteraeota bacterium]